MSFKRNLLVLLATVFYQAFALASPVICFGTLASEAVQLEVDFQGHRTYAQLRVDRSIEFEGIVVPKKSVMYVDDRGHRQEKVIYGTWSPNLDVFAKNSEASKPFEVLLVGGISNLTCGN